MSNAIEVSDSAQFCHLFVTLCLQVVFVLKQYIPNHSENMPRKTIALSLALLTGTGFAGKVPNVKPAGKPEAKMEVKAEAPKEKSPYDSLWNALTLYKDKDGSILNEFKIVGRAHFDEYYTDSNVGWDQDWVVRRLRLGVKATLFHNLDLHVEVDLDPQNPGGALHISDPTYQRLTDAYVSWKFCDAAKLTVGKQSVKFTLDGGTSSNELITIDRNNLTNNVWFTTEYISGVSMSGKVGNWQYNTGIFSGGSIFAPQSTFANSSKEFGNFNGGNFWLGSIGYDLAGKFGVKKALVRADVIYNDPSTQSNATKNFSWIESLTFQFDAGRWGFSTDMTAANGSLNQPDIFGVVVMPWYNITDKLQVVGRYTYMTSDGNNGISFNRYENVTAVNTDARGNIRTNALGRASTQRGDDYNELYAGLNYYLSGHKLKLQTGFSYAWMRDGANDGGRYDGWSWTTGLRISW